MSDYKEGGHSGKLHINGANPPSGRKDYRSNPEAYRGDYRSDPGAYRDDYRSDPGAYRGDYRSDPGAYRGDYRSDPNYYGSDRSSGYHAGDRGDYGRYSEYDRQPGHKKSKMLPILLGSLGALFAAILIIGIVLFVMKRQVGGVYKASWDAKDYVNSQMGFDLYKSMTLDIYIDLEKDHSYHLYNDEEQYKDALIKGLSENDLVGTFANEDDIRDYIESSSDNLRFDYYGSYETKGQTIIFDPGSSEEQVASLKGDGSFTMAVPDGNDGYMDLEFRKQ